MPRLTMPDGCGAEVCASAHYSAHSPGSRHQPCRPSQGHGKDDGQGPGSPPHRDVSPRHTAGTAAEQCSQGDLQYCQGQATDLVSRQTIMHTLVI